MFWVVHIFFVLSFGRFDVEMHASLLRVRFNIYFVDKFVNFGWILKKKGMTEDRDIIATIAGVVLRLVLLQLAVWFTHQRSLRTMSNLFSILFFVVVCLFRFFLSLLVLSMFDYYAGVYSCSFWMVCVPCSSLSCHHVKTQYSNK